MTYVYTHTLIQHWVCAHTLPPLQVLEPKDGKVIYKDWDAIGSDISKLETFDDDEQPLPQNVSKQGYITLGGAEGLGAGGSEGTRVLCSLAL